MTALPQQPPPAQPRPGPARPRADEAVRKRPTRRGTGRGLPSVRRSSPDAVVRDLELRVVRQLDGLLHGDHLGLLPGPGSEAGETRLYLAGDDVRRIDWNVSARTLQPHVRDTVADHELETTLLVDVSPSVSFGTAKAEKIDVSTAATAVFGFLTAQRGGRVGAIVTGGRGAKATVVPHRPGRAHVAALLRTVASSASDERPDASRRHGANTRRRKGPPTASSRLSDGLVSAARLARRRGVVICISDFLDPTAEWEAPLRALSARHDLIAIEIIDPRELVLPDVGEIALVDPETDRWRRVDTSDDDLRARYAAGAAEQRRRIGAALRQAGADHLVLHTDADWTVELVRFVRSRRRRALGLARVRGR